MNLKDLAKPFPAKDIEWRIQSSGKNDKGIWAMCLAYVTNRAIMDRLDEVCGPENWKNDFAPAPEGGILCGISIKCGDEWVTKWDGAENTQVEAIKGGLSSAMKRAGSQWGIGRYLYNLDTGWADIATNGKFSAKTKDNTWFKWNPPALPSWALPDGTKVEPKKKEKPARQPMSLESYINTIEATRSIDKYTQTYKSLLANAKIDLSTDEQVEYMDRCRHHAAQLEGDAINAKDDDPPF